MDEVNNVISVTFSNENEPPEPALFTCECGNKTYKLLYYGEDTFPVIKCAACDSPAGYLAWVDFD